MTASTALPGVAFAATRLDRQPSALRSDVAAFLGRTQRGPLGEAVRVEGWRAFERSFGGLLPGAHTPYAVRGYFENGGEVAWIVRAQRGAPAVPPAKAWTLWEVSGASEPFAALAGFGGRFYRLSASSPGEWANGCEVVIRYRRAGGRGPSLDVSIAPHEAEPEQVRDIEPSALSEALANRSRYLRATALSAPPPAPAGVAPGPNVRSWTLRLRQGQEPAVDEAGYLDALTTIAELPEPALLGLPDLLRDLEDVAAQRRSVLAAARLCEAKQDRLVLVDLPPEISRGEEAAAWIDGLGDDRAIDRNLAAYHPWIRVDDPLGGSAEPLLDLPPSGHVAGAMSRVDRERGAYVTPANVSLEGVVDVAAFVDVENAAGLNELGVNAIRCQAGRGMMIWGGRMLRGERGSLRFVAHRRLLHRLVRAIRRVARALVFENNGPELWLALSRSATTLLLEAYRAGALKGARPQEAFVVRCDEELNPAAVRDEGKVFCEISFAPAVPMEFITIRVGLSADGKLDVSEP